MNIVDVDLERSIIASCITDKSMCEKITAGNNSVNTEDFFQKTHQDLYDSIVTLTKDTYTINSTDLHALLSSKYKDIGKYVDKIIECPTITSTKPIEALKLLTIKRKLSDFSVKLKSQVGNDFTEDCLIDLQKEFLNIELEKQDDSVCLSEISDHRFQKYETIKDNPNSVTGIFTNLAALDHLTLGFEKKELIILAGRTSMGKTAFSLNIARNMLNNRVKVGYFSLEMSIEALYDRLFATQSTINSIKFRSGQFTQQNWSHVIKTHKYIKKHWDIRFDDKSAKTSDIIKQARKMKNNGVQIIFIDQLSHVIGNRKFNRYEEVSQTVRDLKQLAKELNIPIVLLAQLNRAFTDRQNKEPQLSDLRESGQIEQEADKVLFIYRPFFDTKNPDDEKKGLLYLAKNREGQLGNIFLHWEPKLTLFSELGFDL